MCALNRNLWSTFIIISMVSIRSSMLISSPNRWTLSNHRRWPSDILVSRHVVLFGNFVCVCAEHYLKSRKLNTKIINHNTSSIKGCETFAQKSVKLLIFTHSISYLILSLLWSLSIYKLIISVVRNCNQSSIIIISSSSIIFIFFPAWTWHLVRVLSIPAPHCGRRRASPGATLPKHTLWRYRCPWFN